MEPKHEALTLLESSSCIVGEGSRHSAGYRVRNVQGEMVYAHRAAWEAANGPIPESRVVHHICGNKWCVNPEHLELHTKSSHSKVHNKPITVCPRCGSTERAPYRSRPGKTYCVQCVRKRDRLRPRKPRKDHRIGAPLILCACGCGTEVPTLRKDGKPRMYAHGHNPRSSGANTSFWRPDGSEARALDPARIRELMDS
jgi:hypothetical protein